MLTKNFAVEVKAGPDDGLKEGEFIAYASVFGNKDSYGDVVMPGAFANTIAEWVKSGDTLPILFGHNMSDPDYNIGGVVEASEDAVGLKVHAALDLECQKGLQTYRLLKGRRIRQMSFAYDEIESGPGTHNGEPVWELRELKVYEVSVVTAGANQETEILAVKSIPTVAERTLRDLKAGRVLSSKNEGELREAHEAIGRVLSALDNTTDEEKASGEGPSRQDDSSDGSKNDPREASNQPSVDPSVLDLLELEMAYSSGE